MPVKFNSGRTTISQFEMKDAEHLFACILPAITVFMPWEPPSSVDQLRERRQELMGTAAFDDFWFVIRDRKTSECLGSASINDAASNTPEIGIWLRKTVHGHGYGSETIRALCRWASQCFDPQGFIYPVAIANVPSRRIAERLGGTVIAHRTNPKYASVVYRIPRQP
ncbi:MAG: GNAT family N-acetyltransferase [Janthinobacterium lividum]